MESLSAMKRCAKLCI